MCSLRIHHVLRKYLQLIHLMFLCFGLERNDNEKGGPSSKLVYIMRSGHLPRTGPCAGDFCAAIHLSLSWPFCALPYDLDT